MANRPVLEHLLEAYDQPIRDPLWHHIALSPALLRLIQTPTFQQLSGIKQLGPAYLVYPGATHTRFSHSLGVFHLARRMLIQLLRAAPAWRPAQEEVVAFLCAALVHDVGHYPFAHSLKDLDLRAHEQLTADWVVGREAAPTIRNQLGTDPALVAAIVDQTGPPPAGTEAALFRAMLSGVLDPDKLDYLNRAAYFCGVPYGIQDTDFILGELCRHAGGLAVSSTGLPAVESILFSRYLMHRTVYWHKTVRVATAMIKQAVLLGLTEGRLQRRELYGLDDEGFRRLLRERGFAPFQLAERVFRRDLLRRAYATPYDSDQPAHRALEPPAARLAVERRLAADLTRTTGTSVDAAEVIIDLPEPVTFDVELDVVDTAVADHAVAPLMDSATVFAGAVVAGFQRRLRAISLIAPADPVLQRAAAGLGRELLGGGG